MAAEFQDVMIGFKSGVVIKISIEGGPSSLIRQFADTIDKGPTATRAYWMPKNMSSTFDVCDVSFVLPAKAVEVVSGK